MLPTCAKGFAPPPLASNSAQGEAVPCMMLSPPPPLPPPPPCGDTTGVVTTFGETFKASLGSNSTAGVAPLHLVLNPDVDESIISASLGGSSK